MIVSLENFISYLFIMDNLDFQIYKNFIIKRDWFISYETLDEDEIDYFYEILCECEFAMSDIIPLEYDGKNNIISSRRYLDKNWLKYSFFTS